MGISVFEGAIAPLSRMLLNLDRIFGFVLPNFYFHVTTAYDILRHNGLPIGKRDYLGVPG